MIAAGSGVFSLPRIMKRIQFLALAATMVLGAAGPVFGEEKAEQEKPVVYRAGMTGVT